MEDSTISFASEYLTELRASAQAGNPPGDGWAGAAGRLEGYLEMALDRIGAAPDAGTIRRALHDAHAYRMEGADPGDIAIADGYADALAAMGGLGDVTPIDRVLLSPAEADAIERVNDGQEPRTEDGRQAYTLSPDEAKAIEDMRANAAYEAAELDDLAAGEEPRYNPDDLVEQGYWEAHDRLVETYGITDEPDHVGRQHPQPGSAAEAFEAQAAELRDRFGADFVRPLTGNDFGELSAPIQRAGWPVVAGEPRETWTTAEQDREAGS